MAYVVYTPLASSSLPLLDPLTIGGSPLPPSAPFHQPYQTHYILAMRQPSSPYGGLDFSHHLQPHHYQQHQQQYSAGKEWSAHPIGYSASSFPLPLLHQPPSDYSASPPPPSSRVTDCKDWLKGRCMRAAACRFHHSNLSAASSASAPASPYTPASPVPLPSTASAASPFFSTQSSFLSGSSHPSLVGALSPTPLHFGTAAAYSTFPSAAQSAASFAPYGNSGGLASFPSFPCYLPYPNSPNAAMSSYAPPTPSYPLSPSFSAASFTSASSSSPAGSVGGGSHPSPSSASSVSSSSPSSASGSSSGSLPSPSDVCRDYQHGVCFRGSSCRFLHEKQLCGDWLNQKCSRGASCKFSHDKRAGPQCRDWLQGRCTRGEECRYFHSDEPQQSQQSQQSQQPQQQQQAASTSAVQAGACRDWIKGRCLKGAACKFAHSADTSLALAASVASMDGVGPLEVGRKRGREQPPTNSLQPHTLPTVNVTVDPALQSAFNKPLQITMTQQADTGELHITLTNGQHSVTTQQEETTTQHSHAAQIDQQPLQQQSAEAEADGDSAAEEDSERERVEAAARQQPKQPKQHQSSASEKNDSGGADEQIDQTDGAADGDVYLADERPRKKQRGD